MEHSVKTIPGTWYTITATAPATVIELIQGETATLATLKESGTALFRSSTTQITVNTEGKFTVLPTKAPGAPFLGTGGNVQFTDEQAEQLQALAANSANLTAHTGDTTAHITEAEREAWNEKQFTETEEAILKRGVERDFLTRNHTYVFIADENDFSYTLSSSSPLLESEENGNYRLCARLNKDVMKEWLGIGASSSEPMSDKWLIVLSPEIDQIFTDTYWSDIYEKEYTASDGYVYSIVGIVPGNVGVLTCSSKVGATAVRSAIKQATTFDSNTVFITPLY